MTLIARALRILIIVAIVAAAGYAFRGRLLRFFFLGPQTPPQGQLGLSRADLAGGDVTIVAEDLDTPWALAFLPDGSLLVTERPGRLVRISDSGRETYTIGGVREAGEGGLMGLALHPDFAETRWIYVCLTGERGGALENRVERYRFDRGPSERRVILAGIPGAYFHDGCQLGFGPDGYLYISTGDVGNGEDAQERRSLAGKILRLSDDGGVPADNPFGSAVYSYGHRNPQGLTWDEEGRLWSTEHGRSVGGSGFDELNLIVRGANYGWPLIQGDAEAPGMVTPILHSGPNYTWAPGGAAYWNGRIFFGGLRGEALYEAGPLERGRGRGRVELLVHFHGEFGRIRAVRIGPDGMLYFSTSNRDGRGRVRRGDDKIVRIDPSLFQ